MNFRPISLVIAVCASAAFAQGEWRDPKHAAALENDAMRIELQAGVPARLIDRQSGGDLLLIPADQLPNRLAVFGAKTVDLDTCKVTQQADESKVETTYQADDGSQWTVRWSVEPGKGDIVLNAD